jgi:hypothetical protein
VPHAVCNRPVHNKRRARVIGRVAFGANLLIRGGKENGALEDVLLSWAKIQNVAGPGGIEQGINAVGDCVGRVGVHAVVATRQVYISGYTMSPKVP